MEIIRRLARGWEGEEGYGKYQYLYIFGRGVYGGISLVYLEVPRRRFMWETHSIQESSEKYSKRFDTKEEAEEFIMWETHSIQESSEKYSKRFDTKEEAEEFIMESLLGDDLKDLVEWKIAKNNIVIQE